MSLAGDRPIEFLFVVKTSLLLTFRRVSRRDRSCRRVHHGFGRSVLFGFGSG